MQLVLTDNDEASHGALSDVKILEPCWTGVTDMLCVFHGLVIPFHKDVWPQLPHEHGDKHMLTKKGKLYCEDLLPLSTLILLMRHLTFTVSPTLCFS